MEKKGRNWTSAMLVGGQTGTAILVAMQQNFVKIETYVPYDPQTFRAGTQQTCSQSWVYTGIHTKALTGNEGGEFKPI